MAPTRVLHAGLKITEKFEGKKAIALSPTCCCMLEVMHGTNISLQALPADSCTKVYGECAKIAE